MSRGEPKSTSGFDDADAFLDSDIRLVVVSGGLQECPYLDGQVARMPIEYPVGEIGPDDLDRLLERGYRRTGSMFYRTHCPSCRECIPTRLEAARFETTRSFRRILNRASRELTTQWQSPAVDVERVRLFNRHRQVRRLSRYGDATQGDYHEFLVATRVPTSELAFYYEGNLIGASIVDCGADSLNAVYTYFDPEFSRYSLGTLAVLLQIRRAIETCRRYVYLGLYVEENSHLNYKRRFRPQQRLLKGDWQWISQEPPKMQRPK